MNYTCRISLDGFASETIGGSNTRMEWTEGELVFRPIVGWYGSIQTDHY